MENETKAEEKSSAQRSGRKWNRREVKRVMKLLVAGYETDEIAEHIGRSEPSIGVMLASYATTATDLRANANKLAALDLPALPPYDPNIALRDVEMDFPALFQATATLDPKPAPQEASTAANDDGAIASTAAGTAEAMPGPCVEGGSGDQEQLAAAESEGMVDKRGKKK